MDNYKFTISILFILVFALSCTKLEPKIYSDLTTSNAYSTESDIKAALTGLYANLDGVGGYNTYYNGYIVMTTDYTTDMGFSTAAGDPTQMTNFSYTGSNHYIYSNWTWPYKLISNVNLLLSKIDDVKLDEDTKNQIIGQAKFLRALAYRDLTDAWGAIPLIMKVINPNSVKNIPLSSVSRVDSLIISDCKDAIDNLPEQWDASEGLCRATKGAALTLLGKIYMREHDYINAKKYIDQVIALWHKGVYELDPDFRNVWSGHNPDPKEMIFGILHNAARNPGLEADHFGPTDNPDAPNRWAYYAVSLYFWRKYDTADPRREFFWYNYEGLAPRDPNTTHGFYYMMPKPGQTKPPADTVKLLQDVTTKKYTYQLIANTYYDSRTVIIFRLSDVILCKAEIENALNGPSAALSYINEVRGRAGAPLYGKDPRFPTPSNKEEMAKKILDERGFELVFEFKHRADLIRFGKYVEVCNDYIKNYLGLNITLTNDNIYVPYPVDDSRFNEAMKEANQKRTPR